MWILTCVTTQVNVGSINGQRQDLFLHSLFVYTYEENELYNTEYD